ncbi:methyltransferase domain-containing protein [Amycolatopsis sp. NPDC049252]|uniref:methyltransferase domain-containing protein n=1 Tax=Amycolatopsis sp. NPDC049252 TaxID=3363933 RepID=UPI003722904C
MDTTDDMLTPARRRAEQAGVANVGFLKGTIEPIPLLDASVDVVVSDCVIVLPPGKPDGNAPGRDDTRSGEISARRVRLDELRSPGP